MSLLVVADSAAGEVGRWPLAHGQDPVDLLAEHGWAGEPTGSGLVGGEAAIRFAVTRTAVRAGPPTQTAPDGARRLQRLGAYAIVVEHGRLLMSQLADDVVGGARLWTLPGGGVDPGETPVDGVVREVHEETGQHVITGELVQVQSAHRVGPAASGGQPYEDFHAVRLVHRATCPEPTPAQVMEVDGSTGAAAWVRLADVPDLPLGSMVPLAWPWIVGGKSDLT